MQIRMTSDFTYPLDETGSVERTLLRGIVYDEPEVVARAAGKAGKAEFLDPVEEGAAPEALAPEAARRRGR